MNQVRDDETQKKAELDEEFAREHERATKGLGPTDPTVKKAKDIQEELEDKEAKKEAIKGVAIAKQKEEVAKNALENATTDEEAIEAKQALKEAKLEKK